MDGVDFVVFGAGVVCLGVFIGASGKNATGLLLVVFGLVVAAVTILNEVYRSGQVADESETQPPS